MSDDLRQNLEKSGEQNAESDNQIGQPKDKVAPTISVESGLPPNVPPTAPEQNKSDNHGRPIKSHPPNWCEKLTLFLEALGIIGLAIYCVYTIKEWEVFDTESKTMENEFQSNQRNTSANYNIAVAQWQVMQKQSDLMQQQLDDSEAQQRAWIQIEEYKIERITNDPIVPIELGKYELSVSMKIKNVGLTPATDLTMTGEGFLDYSEQFRKKWHLTNFTNSLSPWNGSPPVPNPNSGDSIILPQQEITIPCGIYQGYDFNINDLTNMVNYRDYYSENWISYRDIFGHATIVGEGARYYFSKDSSVPQFIFLGKADQTNQNQK